MTKGLDDILKNLDELQVKAPKVARKAVTEVAEEFEKQLIVNTPVYDIDETLLSEDTAISGILDCKQMIVWIIQK